MSEAWLNVTLDAVGRRRIRECQTSLESTLRRLWDHQVGTRTLYRIRIIPKR